MMAIHAPARARVMCLSHVSSMNGIFAGSLLLVDACCRLFDVAALQVSSRHGDDNCNSILELDILYREPLLPIYPHLKAKF